MQLSTGASYLKRGSTYDYEDFRMTARLGIALGILRNLGITSRVIHTERCALHDKNRGNMRWPGYCGSECVTEWDGPATDATFQAAFSLADAFQTERGRLARGGA